MYIKVQRHSSRFENDGKRSGDGGRWVEGGCTYSDNVGTPKSLCLDQELFKWHWRAEIL
jgi:hypothetical protein